MQLREIMSGEVYTCEAATPVAEVAQALVKRRIGSAVIMQGSWISGIFTERDALRVVAGGSDSTSSPVSAWMTSDPTTATPETGVEEAAEMMAGGGFRHLPVVEGNKLVGIVSLRDVLSTRVARRR